MDYTDKLYACYVALFRLKYMEDDSLINDLNTTLFDIYCILNLFWEDNFGTLLDINKESDCNKLYIFADSIFRYRLLEDKVIDAFNLLNRKDKDNYINDHYDKLALIIEYMRLRTKDFDNYKEEKHPKLKRKDLDSLFKEYLLYIDPSKEYLNIYEKMKEEDRIIYLDQLKKTDQDRLFAMLDIHDTNYRDFVSITDKGPFLFITRKGNISDFVTLAHEFTHFISYSKNNMVVSPVVREFPSMFYELLANVFLQNKGYSSKDTGNIADRRFKDIYIASDMFDIFNYYLDLYKENDCVNKEVDVKRSKERIYNYAKTIGIDKFASLLKEDSTLNNPYIQADEYSISALIAHFKNPYLINDGFYYSAGGFFATKYLEMFINSDDKESILKEMKEYTTNMSNINIDNLFNRVEEDIKDKKKKMSI